MPTCPLCSKPVPLGRGDKPIDQLVNEHMDRDCDSQAAAKKRQKKKEGRFVLLKKFCQILNPFQVLRAKMQNSGIDPATMRFLRKSRLSQTPIPLRPQLCLSA